MAQNKTYDVIIIGGGIIGTSTGYYLSKRGLKVGLLEKDYLTAGSTGRCITGIRQQFSTPTSIQTAMESVRLFQNLKDELDLNIEWTSSGYLFLAHTPEYVEMFKKNIAIQTGFGLDVEFIDAKTCHKIVPKLDTDGLLGAAYCPSDGQANPFLVTKGYAEGIRRNGGNIHINSEVVNINVHKNRIESVTTQKGQTFSAPIVVNAAGPWAKQVGALANVMLEVEPERHEALITEGVQYEDIPMLVDYRPDGGYFVQRVSGQFIGCFTPETQVPGVDTGSSLEFLVEMSRRMARLVPSLENVAILRQWAGSYCMTPDGNPIVDKTDVEGFYCSVGMCGHGFMLGPALGNYLAHSITDGLWPNNMDEFAFGRKFGQQEKMR